MLDLFYVLKGSLKCSAKLIISKDVNRLSNLLSQRPGMSSEAGGGGAILEEDDISGWNVENGAFSAQQMEIDDNLGRNGNKSRDICS